MDRHLPVLLLGVAVCTSLLPGVAEAQWQANGNDLYYLDGTVGIGTSDPGSSGAALTVIPQPSFGATYWGIFATTPPGGINAIYGHTLDGVAIRADADTGAGLMGRTLSGTGVVARADAATGVNIALEAESLSPDGYGIYSTGKNAFLDPVGIGTNIPVPTAQLQVVGAVADLALDVNGQLFVNDAQGFVGVGRSTRLSTTEVFGIEGGGQWAGMYVKTGINQNPYYGYANAGNPQAYHYYHGQNDQWRLWLGADRIAVALNGFVGIGTTLPSYLLHVNGSAGKPGGGSWSNASDLRLKKDVATLEGSLGKLLSLRGVSFEYSDPDAIGERRGRQVGMVAQEVEAVFPDWVDRGPDGFRRLTFRGFEALAVEAVRELRAEKDAEIEALRAENTRLAARLATREADAADIVRRVQLLEAALAPAAAR